MPELPEVETVRRSLVELVVGKTIERVAVGWPKIIKNPLEFEQFQDALKGQMIHVVNRRGKFLIFLLDDYSLVSHLRMEGNYSLHRKGDETDKHTHVVFSFTDGTELRYRDVRKFGTMHLFTKGTEETNLPLAKLGPEPFSADFTVNYLKERLMKTDRMIKAVLLDQTIVTGLGNIYVDEVLFRSKIHPERRAKTLSDQEISILRDEAASTLIEAIEAGGSSVNTYMNSHGISGTYQERLFVYGRKGEECKHCGTPVEKVKLAGRGTHFCPKCQKSNR
ncbi:DNA-formamidopyrimidine glycosylase [Lederbergia citrea]|uniref:Formamidopyrimidine-DNA glycosylase n=1 Tax=Lederbergia citrea TaxID=2833581 RepID=A0A942UPJ3_9BACI|nr:DNA-formamidopyrimidine glycosylase [Lederbergia citrea]MBS4222701.1 DNA-formamidopyrimidine glycosylase [Lederbergia citrea]